MVLFFVFCFFISDPWWAGARQTRGSFFSQSLVNNLMEIHKLPIHGMILSH